MSQHDDQISVRQMLDHAREAVQFARGKSEAEIRSDRLLHLALFRLLEVVGEAASRVSSGYRRKHSEIPWRDTKDLRNRLIHGYDTVDISILWGLLQTDIPRLVEQLEAILPPDAEAGSAS